jgi:hypothetical protein
VSKDIVNVAASVRQRLLNLARARKEDFGLLLTKYALERVLYRISRSPHRNLFVLKGALLFELWTDERYRPTRDADFLSKGDSDPARFAEIFKEICTTPVPDDGLALDPKTVTAERIKENADYEGVRVSFIGRIENARIPMQMDIAFGDTVTPAPAETAFPVILENPPPVLLTYPRETVVAEKFEAMVKLGVANSRMKDIHDLRMLARLFAFEGKALSEAISNTFARRKTAVPVSAPTVFTPEFFENKAKGQQWHAFVEKNRSYVPAITLQEAVGEIERFVMPLVTSAKGEDPQRWVWKPGGPWSKEKSNKEE